MTYEDAQRHIDELMTRYHAPFSAVDKRLISELYPEVLHKTFRATSCQRCFHDAVMEMALFLRKEKKMAEKTRRYTMRAGFIIACPAFHNGKIYSNANITDEIAAEYLAQFPNQIKYFDVKPQEMPSNGVKPAEGITTKVESKKPVRRKNKKK